MAKIEWAHLCDYAFYDNSGKVCLIGIFHLINVKHVPTKHTKCAFAFQIDGESEAKIKFNFQIIRPDGKDPLINVVGDNVTLSPSGQACSIISLDNLPLPDFGRYEIKLILNDSIPYTFKFDVKRSN